MPKNHNWLVRLLEGYVHLRTGAPIGQFRDHDPLEATVPHWTVCAYCNGSGKPCTHDAPRYVDKHTVTKEPKVSWGNMDPMLCRQLAADLDRCIDALPGKARDLFHLKYRMATVERDKDGQVVIRHRNLSEIGRELGIRSMADLVRCHDYHLANMAAQLADWGPGGAVAA